jgi:tRNA(Ile)-lysidine synthase
MASLGPFERSPVLAVATSGGADSMALCLLAAGWAARRGGRVVALIVDHGLRPESQAEARQVGAWLGGRGIDHKIMRWRDPRPRHGLQAAARAARYRLLGDCCRRLGVLHLLLAHHREDQAETFLLRLGRGSGVDGLAAMAPIADGTGARALRPLLEVPKARLVALLRARHQPWLDDPSNLDPAFARTRVRGVLPALAGVGLTPERLTATARRMRRARSALEAVVTDLLAEVATVHPAGFCEIVPAALAGAPAEVALRALARMLVCVGGGAYPPRFDRLERLHDAFGPQGPATARTLGGCRIMPRHGRVLVCREAAAATESLIIRPGQTVLWDGRFAVRLARSAAPRLRQPTITRLGRDGWREIVSRDPGLRQRLPAAVRPSLPALWDVDGVVTVPHLGYCRDTVEPSEKSLVEAVFRPARSLSPALTAAI